MQIYSNRTFGSKIEVIVNKINENEYKLIIISYTKQTPMSITRWHGKLYRTRHGAILRAKDLVNSYKI